MQRLAEFFGRLSGRRTARSRENAIVAIQRQLQAARSAGSVGEQVELLEQAVTLGVRDAALQTELGSAYLRLNKLEQARTAFCAALQFNPGFPISPMARFYAALAATRMKPAPAAVTGASTAQIGEHFISVVICSKEAAKFDAVVANYHQRLAGVPHESIGIHDARSLCEGYNRGVARSRGDIIVFSHDDIEIVSRDLSTKLIESLAQCDIVGVAGTTLLRSAAWSRSGWPHLHGQVLHPRQDGSLLLAVFGLERRMVFGAQALDGLFFAARREVFEKIRFDQDVFDSWHFYDIDFTFSAYTAGFRLAIRADLLIAHYSGGTFDEDWEHYAGRFQQKHAQELAAADGGIKPQILTFDNLQSREEWIATTEWIFAEAGDMSEHVTT
jgi:Glycosyltransferase like family